MRKFLIAAATLLISVSLFSQMDVPASGNNARATVSEEVGITSITIKYSRPDVNKREGKIYGEGSAFLVPYGFTGPSFITGKNMPWRAGAKDRKSVV